ncbi:MAG: FAD-binding oxidoreductase [Candidatus Cloacimonetes bacterium]|nr:FAD-binding oxidoreductase [Candidatus Cloacimonadota bacterium]
MNNYDVVIIGAGSIGVPAALTLTEKKLKVLVIELKTSPGQENNKKAIGGIRATHSDYGKIRISLSSIDIFRTWKEKYSDDIGWIAGGYSFPAYSAEDEKNLKDLMEIQHSFGLNIEWVSAQEYNELVPGINMKDLRGSTYSPDDGSASPLLALNAFYFKSLEYGAEYKFREKVINIKRSGNSSFEIITGKTKYSAKYIINAAGNYAREIGEMIGLDLPVNPDNHEAGITEPVDRFFEPMVVDMRKAPGSANYYFYQNNEGQVVFCITPEPPILGIDNDSTSQFLPMCSQRMVQIYPRLLNLKVRRTWRGQYPMTPDGFPIVGRVKEFPNFINAVGMCGQGFMLGPGLGEVISRIVTGELTKEDQKALQSFDPYRDFSGMEQFK